MGLARTSVNLLPEKYRRREKTRKAIRYWSLGICGLVFVVGVDALMLWQQKSRSLQPLEALRAAASPLAQLGEREAMLARQNHELNRRWKSVADLLPDDEMLQTLGAVATEVAEMAPSHVQLEALTATLHPAQAKTEPHVELRLNVPDDGLAAQFVQNLSQNDRMEQVHLRSSVGGRDEGSRVIEVIAKPRSHRVVDSKAKEEKP